MSGRLWQQRRAALLHGSALAEPQGDEPSARTRAGADPRGRCHQDVRSVIAEINPVVRGWGQYFAMGNAANHFIDVDDYVVKRLATLARQAWGASAAGAKPNAGTASTSKALDCTACVGRSATRANHLETPGGPRNAASRQTTGKPCAGNPHARFERGVGSTPALGRLSQRLMPNIASVLKAEIVRLARKELRSEVDSIRKALAASRAEGAALKRRVSELERSVRQSARAAPARPPSPPAVEEGDGADNFRFRASGMASNRKRLGLSAADFGLLVGASGQKRVRLGTGQGAPQGQEPRGYRCLARGRQTRGGGAVGSPEVGREVVGELTRGPASWPAHRRERLTTPLKRTASMGS